MLLHESTTEALTTYLSSKNFIAPHQKVVETEKPGEGNMNYTIRVKLNDGSIIVKQSNPYVEKYPSVPAPQERALAEATFYKKIKGNSALAAAMPKFIGLDEKHFINAMEDLGDAKDLSFLYQAGEQLQESEVNFLCDYLSVLHNNFGIEKPCETLSNRALRKLNYEHIFVYPFLEDNGFDLDTVQLGLQQLSLKYKNSAALKEAAATLGEHYLEDGLYLVHGDFYPGSWVKTDKSLFIIDPEFCHYGSPSFDLAVMKAHMHLAGQPDSIIKLIDEQYQQPINFDNRSCNKYIGIEILRRIIGLAQLPLKITLEQKEALLQKGCEYLGIKI